MVEETHLSHLPPTLHLYIKAYTSVSNAPHLRQQLLAGNQSYNYAFIDATSLLSRRHLLSACFRALNDHLHNRLKSNNVQSEIVFCLSPNNNIGDAFRRFGIQDSSTDLVVVKVGEDGDGLTREGVAEFLGGAIEGAEVAMSDEWLRGVCDLDRVRKTYKVAKPTGKKAVNGDSGKEGEDREWEEVEAQVLGLMALRGAT